MICAVIRGPTYEAAFQQIQEASASADLVELRFDCFENFDFEAVKYLRKQFAIPMIFTLRGAFDFHRLSELEPDYIDLEYPVPPHLLSQLPSKIILSYHHYESTPENLEEIYNDMKKTPAFYYKIAVTACSSLDAMRFVLWAKEKDDKLIAISMGQHGRISRVLAKKMGSPINYVSLEEVPLAPGQFTIKNFVQAGSNSAVYGLIGNPVDVSLSDVFHNQKYSEQSLDAVYVKMPVQPEELPQFLQMARQLPFRGLSVTMPLKEQIIAYLDEIDLQAQEIGAVNTLLFEKGKIRGYNTDGKGALNAIEKVCSVKGKSIVIIGAGGAAKAIAYEAIRRGGKVIILNRDAKRAQDVARILNCEGLGLEQMQQCALNGYDILINSTPAQMPINKEDILSDAIVMDIKSRPKETEILIEAQKKGCKVVYGYEMFVEQALGQIGLWF